MNRVLHGFEAQFVRGSNGLATVSFRAAVDQPATGNLSFSLACAPVPAGQTIFADTMWISLLGASQVTSVTAQ